MKTVTVRVSPALKEYLCAVNGGSDVIIPSRESRLWGLVKTHLELVPAGFLPTPACGRKDAIRIAIYTSHRRCYNYPSRKVIVTDTLWRDYLTDEGQSVVARYLMHYFKHTFRSYMTGALANNAGSTIRDVILGFCELHKISMDMVTYEMLRKDWFRFRQRHPDGFVIPIENKDF